MNYSNSDLKNLELPAEYSTTNNLLLNLFKQCQIFNSSLQLLLNSPNLRFLNHFYFCIVIFYIFTKIICSTKYQNIYNQIINNISIISSCSCIFPLPFNASLVHEIFSVIFSYNFSILRSFSPNL